MRMCVIPVLKMCHTCHNRESYSICVLSWWRCNLWTRSESSSGSSRRFPCQPTLSPRPVPGSLSSVATLAPSIATVSDQRWKHQRNYVIQLKCDWCAIWFNMTYLTYTLKLKRLTYLRFSPSSPHSYSSCCGSSLVTNSFKCACSSADQTSSSLYAAAGSRLKRSEPENRTGS